MKREFILCVLFAAMALPAEAWAAPEACPNELMTGPPDRLLIPSTWRAAPELRVPIHSADPDPPAVGTIAFASDRRLLVDDPVSGVAAGDFDGDGSLDFATVSWSGASVSVVAGAAGGGWAQATSLALPSGAAGVAAADLDGDGADEILVALYHTGQVAVVRVLDGMPVLDRVLDSGPGTSAIVAGDFDRDGRPDFASTNYANNTLIVFHNAGGGALDPPVRYFTGMGPDNPVAVDVDADGDLDIVTADAGCLSVSALLNRGDGTFKPRTTSLLPGTVMSVAAGDLDGDGDPDLAAPSYDGLMLLENTGSGHFRLATRLHHREYESYAAAIVDLDGDGRPDVLATTLRDYVPQSHQKVAVHMNEGEWTFAPEVDYATGFLPVKIFARDIDADGLVDIVTGNYGGHGWYQPAEEGPSVSILHGRRDGTLGAFADVVMPGADEPDFDEQDYVSSVYTVSFGSGGRDQILVGQRWSTNLVEDLGGGRNRITEVFPNQVLAVLDVNGDGISDLLAAGLDEANVIEVWTGAADRSFSLLASYPDSRFATTLDFDGDRQPDIVTLGDGDALMLLRNLGGGAFGEQEGLGAQAGPNAVAFGGRELDGKRGDELVITRDYRTTESDLVTDSVTVLLNWHVTEYRHGWTVPIQPCPCFPHAPNQVPKYLGFGDVDNDVTMDVLVVSTSYDGGGYQAVLSNDGTGRLRLLDYEWSAGNEPVGFVVEDFDDDGWLDTAVADAKTGDPGLLYVFQGVGEGQFQQAAVFYPGDYPRGIAGGDFDGNGTMDLALVTFRMGLLVKVLNGGPPPSPIRLPATVESVVVDAAGVHIEWAAPGLNAAIVERAAQGRHWETFGAAEVLGPGRFRVSDPDPGRGSTGYRLALNRSGVEVVGSEVWVNARPDDGPVLRRLSVVAGPEGSELDLGLEQAGPVQVEMFDVSGRRVLAQRLDWLPAGHNMVQLPAARQLGQGVYWARVRQEASEARTKVVVVK